MRLYKVFVSGPIRKGRVSDNLRGAMRWASWLMDRGFLVYVPHAQYLWEIAFPRPEQDWMDHDLLWLEDCDAMFRVSGPSEGADIEERVAKGLGIPVFTDANPEAIVEWASEQNDITKVFDAIASVRP